MIGRSPTALNNEPNEPDVANLLSNKIQKPVAVPFTNNIWGPLLPNNINNNLFKSNDALLEVFNAMLNNSTNPIIPEIGAQKHKSPELYIDVCGNSPLSNQSSVDVCSQASHSNTETSSSPSPHSISGGSRRSSVSQDVTNHTKKSSTTLPPTRIYRRVTDEIRDSDEYKTKRLRNNDAVRRSRENSKLKRDQERHRLNELTRRYNVLVEYVKKCKCGKYPDFIFEESK